MYEDKILMICPSRGRPQKAYETIEAFEKTYSKRSQLIFYIDDDDPTTKDYPKPKDPDIMVHIGPRRGISGSINQAVVDYPNYRFYGFIGDDHRFRTDDWDKVFIETIDSKGKGWGVAYGDDLLVHETIPTQVVISKNIIDVLGFMVYPEIKHQFVDNFWKEIGLTIDRLFYIPEVIIEHMHYVIHKSPMDQTYREVNSPKAFAEGEKAFTDFKVNLLDIYSNKLKEVMNRG